MTPEEAEQLVPLAAELVGSVRDFGNEVVADVLARVPNGRHDALAVVLAAMVDPDARPSELLSWTSDPVPSRPWEPLGFRTDRRVCPECGRYFAVKALAKHRRRHVERAA